MCLQQNSTQIDPEELLIINNSLDGKPWVEVGKATRRKRRAASSELRICGWVVLLWQKCDFPQKFHRPARTPSFRPQWARRARWRTWGSRDSPWCSPAWAPCTSRSPPAWTQGPGLHTGVSSSKNMRLNTMVNVKHKLESASSINLIRCKGTKPVHGENCVEACPQCFQLTPHTPVVDKLA